MSNTVVGLPVGEDSCRMRPEAPSYSPLTEYVFVDRRDPACAAGSGYRHAFRVTPCGDNRNAVRVTDGAGYDAIYEVPSLAPGPPPPPPQSLASSTLKKRVDALEAGNARLWNAVRRLLYMASPPRGGGAGDPPSRSSASSDARSPSSSEASEASEASDTEAILERLSDAERQNARHVERIEAAGVASDILAERLARAEAANEDLADRLARAEALNGELADLLAKRDSAAKLDRLALEAARAEADALRSRLASLDDNVRELQRAEASMKGERDKLRAASKPVSSERDKYRGENARLREELRELRDAKALADAMQVRAAAAEALADERSSGVSSLEKQLVAVKRCLAHSLERNKSSEAKHAMDMASALSMIDAVITESENRAVDSLRDVGKTTELVSSLASLKNLANLETQKAEIQKANAKKADAPKANARKADAPKADAPKAKSDVDSGLRPAPLSLDQTRAAGILLCIAVMTQAGNDVRRCFMHARNIPEPLLTKSGGERRRKAYESSGRSVAEFATCVDRLCSASLGGLRVGLRGETSPFCPEFITDMYREMLNAAGRDMFDPEGMCRLQDVFGEMAQSMRIGLRLAESEAPSEAARAVHIADPALHLRDLMDTVNTFEEAAPGEDDEALFQHAMLKWQDNLALLVPWRATADRAFHLSQCRFTPF
jgi:hypothetical protein